MIVLLIIVLVLAACTAALVSGVALIGLGIWALGWCIAAGASRFHERKAENSNPSRFRDPSG